MTLSGRRLTSTDCDTMAPSLMSTTTSPPATSLLTANLICMLSMLIWAAGLPAADVLIPLLPPEQLNALRMAMAALFLVPVWAMVEGWAPLARVNWGRGVLVGSLIGLGAWLLIQGQTRSGPVTVAVISAMLPVAGIGFEVVLDGRRLTPALVLGLILSLIGGVLALDFRGGGLSFGLGALFCLASVASFALGSRLTVTAFPDQTPLGRTAVTLAGAAVAAGLVAGVQGLFGGSGTGLRGLGRARDWVRSCCFPSARWACRS